MSTLIGLAINSFKQAPITDVGSAADTNLSLWQPELSSSPGYFYLGYYPTNNYNSPPNPAGPQFVFQNQDSNSNTCLAAPIGFTNVWKCINNDQPSNLGIYNLQAPDEYIAIGSIAVSNFNFPPQLSDAAYSKLMCVHQTLCVQVALTSVDVVWTDKGSGASDNVIVWMLPNSQTCFAKSCSGSYNEEAIAWDVSLGFLNTLK